MRFPTLTPREADFQRFSPTAGFGIVQTMYMAYAELLTMRTTASRTASANTSGMQSDAARQNYLLAALPDEEWERWHPQLEQVDMKLGEVLYEPGATMNYVYFPTTAIVSLLYVMKNGASAEIAVVGFEGLVGIALFMGGGSTSSRAVVQNAGRGYRLPAQALKQEFESPPVLHLLLRYTQALIAQMVQTAACNRHHSLHQQLCRWLLLSLDRLRVNELVMTQELIANMLGVPLDGYTEDALKLERAGIIRYEHGHITVLNRAGLEECTCECYLVVKKEYDRLLPRTKAD